MRVVADEHGPEFSALGEEGSRRRYWLRALLVAATVAATFLSVLGLFTLAASLGISPGSMQGASAQITPQTVALILSFYAIQIGLICGVHRFVHRQPLQRLGLSGRLWPEIGVGFLVGAAVGALEKVADVVLASGAALRWAVPAEVSVASLVAHYLLWFVVISTLSSLNEELSFRVYPLEHLVDGKRSPVLIVVLTALAFALIHHLLEPFSWRAFVSRALAGLLLGFAYHRYRSLWLICGLHSGMNFFALSLSGNWQLGGLWELSLQTGPEPLRILARILIAAGALLVIERCSRIDAPASGAQAGPAARTMHHAS
jgi:membrane protease YdiL (CAAX protease family)